MFAAAISQRNSKLHIGFAVLVAPLRHPVRFVTQMNLLDQLSGGRLIIGVGAGNSPDEFAGFGYDRERRHELINEFMAAALAAWGADGSEPLDYDAQGLRGQIRGRVIPESVQRPHPPIVYATATPERLEMVGRHGWGLLLGTTTPELIAGRLHHYVAGMRQAGLDEAAQRMAWSQSAVLRHIYVAAPGEDWRETIGDCIETYVRKSVLANTGIDELPKDDLDARTKRYMEVQLVAGQPEEIVERVRPFAELGIDQLMCWFQFGHMDPARVQPSIRRFAEHVAPRLGTIGARPGLIEELVEAAGGPITRAPIQVSDRESAKTARLR